MNSPPLPVSRPVSMNGRRLATVSIAAMIHLWALLRIAGFSVQPVNPGTRNLLGS